MDFKSKIRLIEDFPKKGILFRDITPILQDPEFFQGVISKMVNHFKYKKIDKVVCAESRGFILGSAVADRLKAGFVPLRKPGKLPHTKIKHEFKTEYSIDAFEIHTDAINKGENVLIVDDLLATGGTIEASTKLVERLGGNIVGISFLIELMRLEGRKKIENYHVYSIIEDKD